MELLAAPWMMHKAIFIRHCEINRRQIIIVQINSMNSTQRIPLLVVRHHQLLLQTIPVAVPAFCLLSYLRYSSSPPSSSEVTVTSSLCLYCPYPDLLHVLRPLLILVDAVPASDAAAPFTVSLLMFLHHHHHHH